MCIFQNEQTTFINKYLHRAIGVVLHEMLSWFILVEYCNNDLVMNESLDIS